MTPETPQNDDHETPPPYTLKIRQGCEGGGKGALIQTNKSGTLSTNNDQYLFQPTNDIHSPILDDQGGQQISVRTDGKSPTLRAETHGNLPCVVETFGVTTKGNGDAFINPETHTALSSGGGQAGQGYPCVMQSAGFKPNQGSKAQGMGYAVEQAPTLLAGQEPGVCISFEPGVASRCGGHTYEGISGTIRATPGDNQMTVAYSVENHPNDSRVKIDETGKVQALTSRMGTGGGNVPMVLEEKAGIINLNKGDVQSKTILDPDGIAPSLYAGECRGGGGECYVLDKKPLCMATQQGGAEIMEDKSPTITAAAGMSGNNQPDVCMENTAGEPVVYNGENITSPVNKANPVPGDPCHTLGTDPRNYVVYPADASLVEQAAYSFDSLASNSMKYGDKHDGAGNGLGVGSDSDPMYTLTSGEHHAICTDVGFFNSTEDVSTALLARMYKDPPLVTMPKPISCMASSAVNAETTDGKISPCLMARAGTGGNQLPLVGLRETETQYIVRRLTPLECNRLQGFPDGWGETDQKEDFTDEEYKFWHEVRNTYAAINGKKLQAYTKQQMLKWYNKLHTDSAEYKMWGNGIALPTALYVMEGIAEALKDQETESHECD